MKKIRTCVFPIAGQGKRLGAATRSVPKEMLTVVDKPLIQYAVEEAKAAGIERFIFVTSAAKISIENYFDSSDYLHPWQVAYVHQREPLGLANALSCCRLFIDDDCFAVILPDDLIDSEPGCLSQMLNAYHSERGNMLAVTQVDAKDAHQYGIIKNHTIVEKPQESLTGQQTAVVGRYILRRSIFEYLQTEIELSHAINHMLPQTALTIYPITGQRFDCGNLSGWLDANVSYAQKLGLK